MSTHELGSVVGALLLLLLCATLAGQLFSRFRQPKVVGEILAGILLGPTLFGELAPTAARSIFGDGGDDPSSIVLGFVYHLGLLLLMFVSGFSVRHVLDKKNRVPTAWILGVGAPLRFLIALGVGLLLPIGAFVGEAGSRAALLIVFAIAATVTSIPVITKIFYDLGILHTRFASLMIGVAVCEDILLWGALSVATAIASATLATTEGALMGTIITHVITNTAYVLVALVVMPPILRRAGQTRWNTLARQTPIAWAIIVLLGYVAVAAVLDVTLIFAAFLAGFGIVGGMKRTERTRYRSALDSIENMSTAVFIPLYFAIVGYRLDLRTSLDPVMLLGFLLGTSLIVFVSIGLAARLAGFRRLDLVNLALTCNARGGPGIVLASVAFDAGIINAPFFTTLVLTAVLTSQACGFWLDHVLRKGQALLSGTDLYRRGIEPTSVAVDVDVDVDETARH
jgi:Kef-type K+ transport system membrane component KefB